MKLSRVIVLGIVTSIIFVSAALAAPKITWYYQNDDVRGCRRECVSRDRITRTCWQYREVCNKRSAVVWSSSQKRLVKRAMNILATRVDNRSVKSCVQKHTKYFRGSYAPKNNLSRQGWLDFNALASVSRWPEFNLVSKTLGNSGIQGRTTIARIAYGTGNQLKWSGRIGMELNVNAIDTNIRRDGFDVAAENLAGTIFHEMLHQMGHQHPDTGDYNKDYLGGHFVVMAGDCIASNGKETRTSRSLGLTSTGRRWYKID